MTFRTGIWVRIPTSKQLSGMGATRRMPTWYAADYFPNLIDHTGADAQMALASAPLGEHVMQSRPRRGDDDNPLLLNESSTQESSEGEGDTSAISDAQGDSSSDVCSVESEVADPSWIPPPVDVLANSCPMRAPDRRRPGGKRTRPLAGGREGGALLRALSLRSRTITMGTQKRRGRARLLQQRSSRPQARPRTRRSGHGEAPATRLVANGRRDRTQGTSTSTEEASLHAQRLPPGGPPGSKQEAQTEPTDARPGAGRTDGGKGERCNAGGAPSHGNGDGARRTTDNAKPQG